MDGRKNLAPPLFSKRPPPLKNKGGGALAPPFRKKRVVACARAIMPRTRLRHSANHRTL